jgi:hypothetical protein
MSTSGFAASRAARRRSVVACACRQSYSADSGFSRHASRRSYASRLAAALCHAP